MATDATGKFKLEIPAQKEMILIFNFIGMASQTITVTKSEELHVVLKEDTRELEDVVVTSYYTQAKNAYTGGIDHGERGGFAESVPDESDSGAGLIGAGFTDCGK